MRQKILIAWHDINQAIKLMNYINANYKNIIICNIARSIKETLAILNDKNNIDFLLLDYEIFPQSTRELFDKIVSPNDFKKSFIILSVKSQHINNSEENQKIRAAIFNSNHILDITNEINTFISYRGLVHKNDTLTTIITNEILNLGYDISLKGTKYLIETIKYIAQNSLKQWENLEKNIYPQIGKLYNTSVQNIKCRINGATTLMYNNCDDEKLKKYLHSNIDGKPKIKIIIHEVLTKLM